MEPSSYIFDIKPYAINDGPGIRLTIFFKGCPLSCKWCHNPESISPKKQKFYTEKKCIGAKKCIEICPNDALKLTSNGLITDYSKCKLCGLCADVCPTKAIEMSGNKYTLNELMHKVEKERMFFESSGGGVTLSGGEPMMHPQIAIPLLEELGKKGIHRTVDTSGYTSITNLNKFINHTDLFLFDLKVVDQKKHIEFTGKSNKKIIENLNYLSDTGTDYIIRIPLIKGVNTSEKDFYQFAELINNLTYKPKEINILPYHDIAKMKYKKLGSSYDDEGLSAPTEDDISKMEEIFSQFNLEITVGG
ncbi:MAG: glycyl-radical enzyme activating protein [Marinilabiliales bacterium]|nr:MAG: glycyl-radical enzyme activating protein [Marinilabiliales bacterium]